MLQVFLKRIIYIFSLTFIYTFDSVTSLVNMLAFITLSYVPCLYFYFFLVTVRLYSRSHSFLRIEYYRIPHPSSLSCSWDLFCFIYSIVCFFFMLRMVLHPC